MDTTYNIRVALKKLARPFQSNVHAKRTYRELRLLKHMKHENVGPNNYNNNNYKINNGLLLVCCFVCFQIIGLLDAFSPSENYSDFQDL